MHKYDTNRVEFYSKEDLAGGFQLSKGENILRNNSQADQTDINDILEFHHIKKYIDNELYLKNWTKKDISDFQKKSIEFNETIGQFISNINNENINILYENVLRNYIDSFWELINNHEAYKRISKANFRSILLLEPFLIRNILTHKRLVGYYDKEIRDFLLNDTQSAEILLSIYEVKDDCKKSEKFLPKCLTIDDKEKIISNYLDETDTNLNYIGLIQNAKNRNDFKISDKTRLKAKRLHKSITDKFFEGNQGIKYGVSISFPKNATKIKDGKIDEDDYVHNSYSADFILKNNNPYVLFQNFDILFEYIDEQKRIDLVSKRSQISTIEGIMGIRSENEYWGGTAFSLSEMTSQGQIFGYSKVLYEMETSIEDILQFMFTVALQEKYNFANNVHFSIPLSTNSYLEKIRLMAPEFESILKQFKLYVEDGVIDFELLQISSSPTTIKNIPSLNSNKYIYFNEQNKEMVGCSNIFFSDQTHLTYIEPFKEKKYRCFFDLLANETINFDNYGQHQKPQLNYLIEKGFIKIDSSNFIQITNFERLYIFKDLYENEFASFHHYPLHFQKEAQQMVAENIIYFESSLFSKSEQAYFNYFLNKSEFTNGLDLRNSYLHGTQANPDEVEKHEFSYFIYLKLIILSMFKIEDDLAIFKENKNISPTVSVFTE